MNIENDLKKEGIEVIEKIDGLITNTILKSVARRIVETFPNFEITEKAIYDKLSNLKLYKAKMPNGMAEASYYYKNTSIYFNEHIEYDDIEEFAIHECIHYLQEKKDENNNILAMGLCTYKGKKVFGLALNEAAVQFTSARIIGIDADFEKYYNINLYTPSPSYYPVECSLLYQLMYFTGEDVLFKNTIFSDDSFKNKIISMTSLKTYNKLISLFDNILSCEEKIITNNNKVLILDDGDEKIDTLNEKSSKLKEKIVEYYFNIQNIIIKEFFDYEFEQISSLEDLETYRRRLYKYSNIIGSIPNYKFFDDYYIIMMNKLEHKYNVLENGGIETAIVERKHNFIIEFFKKVLKFGSKKKAESTKGNV